MGGRSSNSTMSPGRCNRAAARRIISPISRYSTMTSSHVSSVMLMGGSVKFSSGKTFPPPTVRPKPHVTGLGDLPNVKPEMPGITSRS